jgi:hypothetical protein
MGRVAVGSQTGYRSFWTSPLCRQNNRAIRVVWWGAIVISSELSTAAQSRGRKVGKKRKTRKAFRKDPQQFGRGLLVSSRLPDTSEVLWRVGQ